MKSSFYYLICFLVLCLPLGLFAWAITSSFFWVGLVLLFNADLAFLAYSFENSVRVSK